MKKWVLKNSNKEKELEELKASDKLKSLSSSVIEILYNRGFKTVEDIIKHLYSSLDNLYDTRLMKDSLKATKLIIQGIKDKCHFVVYADYDSDGTCGGSTLYLGLKNLGAHVDYFTNNRFDEGYGISPLGVTHMLEKFPTCDFIITVDNGILGFDGVQFAKDKGLKVVVVDHHEQDESLKLPNADAVVDPKRKDCPYPFKGLCGGGLAFKLMLLLYWEMNEPLDYVYSLLDIVAVATVGDLVPLVDENRILVKEGLKLINKDERPFFRLLREKCSVSLVDEYTLGFVYVPMINALGRIDGSPIEAIEAITSDDEEVIKRLIDRMYDLNQLRKEMTVAQVETAIKITENTDKTFIVVWHESFHEGIVGLVAGRLKELYNKPVIALANHHGIWKGSARSIEGFHLFENLNKVSHLLEGFGGHAMAAGLSIKEENLEKFQEEIDKIAKETLTEDQLKPKVYIDSVLTPEECNMELIDELDLLKPFGVEFSKPIFGLKDFEVKKSYFMGSEGNHLKLLGDYLSLIYFNGTESYNNLGNPSKIKCLGYPTINVYKNNVSVQFMVNDDNFVKSR